MTIRKLRTADRLLYGVLVCCIFSFKIYIVGVGGSGIRADDLLILAVFLYLLYAGDLHRIKRSHPFNIYLGFIIINIVSAIWNSIEGRVEPLTSAFFVARLMEYMVFYYLGYRIAKKGIPITRMLSYYLVFLCVVVPLQMIGLLPSFGAFGGITSRAIGNTNGPYELAAVGAFLLCYLGYDQKNRVKGLFSFLLILLSASRITFVAAAFSVAKVVLKQSRSKSAVIGRVAFLAAVGLVGFLSVHMMSNDSSDGQESVVGRLSSAASTGISLDTLRAAYDSAPVYADSANYIQGAFLSADTYANQGGGDVSGLTRVFRWTSLIKSTLNRFDTFMIGLGPSFGTTAVDGYFVRVFAETGFLGLLMFGWFAKAVLAWSERYSSAFHEYAFILLVTGCFIDIFTSYKPMLLLWLWHGALQFKHNSNDPRDQRIFRPGPKQSATMKISH
jgi:hypothetical protein